MPSIKYKKKTYAGGSMPVLEMTQAQYNALPAAKQNDGTIYLITDGTGGWEAERSTYDNTESGLTATNVQDALDELAYVPKTVPNEVSLSNEVTYTTPSDGYFLICSPNTNDVSKYTNGIVNNRFVMGVVSNNVYGNLRQSLFVKKGMRIRYTTNGDGAGFFYPFV